MKTEDNAKCLEINTLFHQTQKKDLPLREQKEDVKKMFFFSFM